MEKLNLKDFLKYRYPSSLQLSPDGSRLAFAVKEIDEEADDYRWQLWLYDRYSETVMPLPGSEGQHRPIWDDDSHLIHLRYQPDPQMSALGIDAVWTELSRLNVDNGTLLDWCRLPLKISRIWKLGDGRYVFIAQTRLDAPNLLELSGLAQQQEIARHHHTKGYKVLTELPLCENGVGIYNQERCCLFLLDANGKYRSITPSDWDVNHVNVQDGQVLFTAFPFRDIKPVTEGMYRWDPTSDTIATLITADKYSIDYVGFLGKKALCLGLVMKEYGVYEHPTFFVVDECGEHNLGRYDRRVNPEVVTDCFDGSVTGQRMVGEQLFFLNTNGIGTQLCQWSRGSSVRPLLSTDDYLIDFDTHDGQHFFFVATIGLSLPEVYFWDGGALQQLTYLNENVFSEKSLCQPEAFSFQTRDGIGIDGFILKPLGYQPGHSYPGILHIHGGPKMVFGPGFHHEMQLWASNGYFVCYCNPRGSCGKGNAFANLQEKYGTIDFQDLMDFTDEVFRRYPDLDCQRMGVVGGSYGGFMTNWIIGHTNRFRCAVSQRGIANYMSDYLLSDIGYYYVPDQQGGTIWKHLERLLAASPLLYANHVNTPTLFIHSEKDYRCTLANGLEMFAALKLHGVETRLCMFFDEDHGLSRTGKPSNRICRMEEILNWLNSHLKEDEI